MASDPHRISWQTLESLLEAETETGPDASPLLYTSTPASVNYFDCPDDSLIQGWPYFLDSLASHIPDDEHANSEASHPTLIDPRLCQPVSFFERKGAESIEEANNLNGTETARAQPQINSSETNESNTGGRVRRQKIPCRRTSQAHSYQHQSQ